MCRIHNPASASHRGIDFTNKTAAVEQRHLNRHLVLKNKLYIRPDFQLLPIFGIKFGKVLWVGFSVILQSKSQIHII